TRDSRPLPTMARDALGVRLRGHAADRARGLHDERRVPRPVEFRSLLPPRRRRGDLEDARPPAGLAALAGGRHARARGGGRAGTARRAARRAGSGHAPGLNARRSILYASDVPDFRRSTNPTPAVVVGMCTHGLAIARSLGRKGIPVVGLESNP